jgi:hypothetical protein
VVAEIELPQTFYTLAGRTAFPPFALQSANRAANDTAPAPDEQAWRGQADPQLLALKPHVAEAAHRAEGDQRS